VAVFPTDGQYGSVMIGTLLSLATLKPWTDTLIQ
jgi:hypothetical protein